MADPNPLERCERCLKKIPAGATWFILTQETHKITHFESGHPSGGHDVALSTVMLCSWPCIHSYAAGKLPVNG